MSLVTNVSNLATRTGSELKSIRTLINGNQASLIDLTTTNKSTLIAAINEIAGRPQGAQIDDAAVSTLTTWSSSKTDGRITEALNAIIDAAPGTLDTLNEIAAALGDDPNFATTMTNNLASKAPSASPTFTGTVTVPDSSFTIAKTTGLQAAINAKISSFADPLADRLVFWDDSAKAYAPLSLSGMAITGTVLANTVASETAVGVVEQATLAEVTAGTDTTRFVTPQGVRQEINTRAAASHTHTSANITDFSTAVPAAVPASTELVAGKVLLATVAEATTGTDTTHAVTPAGLKAVADTKAASSHTHTAANITDFNTAADARVNALVPAASETAVGKVELATVLEATTGTDTTRAITAAGLKAVADTKAASSHTHTAANITDFNTAADARVNALVPAASETVVGKVELATVLEATTGTDTTRAITAAGLKAVADTKAASSHTHTSANITDFNTAADARVNALVPLATDVIAGKLELATAAEVAVGTDSGRAVTSATLRGVMGDPETNFVAAFEAALVTATV